MSKLKFSLLPDTGTLSERDAKRYFSTVGLATCLMMVVYTAGSVALSLLLSTVAPHLLSNPWVYNLLSVVPLYGLAFPVFWLILRGLPRDGVQPDKMGGGYWFGGLCVSFALMSAGNYIGNFFILAFESALGRSLTNPVEAATVGQSVWINLIFVAVLAPILEELVFRKLLCDRLLPLGEGYAVVLSGAIFGLVHGNFFQFFYAFLIGGFFALVYIKTGRIRYSILYHGIINLLGGVLAPWVLERLDPLMEEEALNRLLELYEKGDLAGVTAALTGYELPLLLLAAYEVLMVGGAIAGVVLIVKNAKKLRLQPGLLPPPREGRVADVFLNGGVAAALAVFALTFVLSLL